MIPGSSFKEIKNKFPELFEEILVTGKKQKGRKAISELTIFEMKTNSELVFTDDSLVYSSYSIFYLNQKKAEEITNKLFDFYSGIYGEAKLEKAMDEPHTRDITLSYVWKSTEKIKFVIFTRLEGSYSYVVWRNEYR
jgi:hypothetical protein